MTKQYRIARPFSSARFGLFWLGIALVLGAVFLLGALGVLLDQKWITALGTALLIGGPAAAIRRYQRENTVLYLHPGNLGIGRWTVPWDAVEKIVLDHDRSPGSPDTMVIGVRLRSRQAVPAGIRAGQLDQTTPNRPVVRLEARRSRVHEDLLARTLEKIGPSHVTLISRTGGADTTLADRP
ncbi:hypothetical protein [Amycolatopsis sp. CA-230715]|uniref:hypothetical protein n=1 Tax=Amycolatopsis sp. CA-230715 TaxID=2745196 RepID=UPI001C00E733|nr:hypothetical protein [Amycolatopsis sp. CA-230715]QWF82439.1 hypothetical protein HUW46_05876 [Amycolatopsis sp. CA-230715]